MSTTIQSIFEKPVDRQIDGVIKADDEESLRLELDEYVLTREIEQNLAKFLDAYNHYATANGVWISGFFGSGKSHLLKMLALVLEDRDVDGSSALSFFEAKLADNPLALADLRKAVAIPSRSILFNIDQKADVISKKEVDAVLRVFQKVLDEFCGYYGKVGHIARFERALDERGILAEFKTAFEEHSKKPWERGREHAPLEKRHIDAAYAEISGHAASEVKDILNEYRADHAVSIEDFANQVKAYIDRQEKDFRLNFFIDEVGQYIAGNTKLMTNLQTIAESLNTRCKGQAWIVVTAQQAMEEIVGDQTSQQENDFSKIQARFAHRMPLNSQDVAEVIQRRLLAKTADGTAKLKAIYGREKNNLRTLFEFTDGSREFKTFRDADHFAASYPYPSYQYDLFQTAIEELSNHNAFEGRHASVGERSMLGVFQEVAKAIKALDVGTLATFDLMFEGIHSALKSNVQRSISVARKNLSDDFTLRVLKALFLVKYVREFKPSVHNISILMLDRLDADQKALRKRIGDALAKLEQDSYIQRNGDLYEFLTDEEKDIENEIKATSIDQTEMAKELDTLVFDNILKTRKIRHEATGHDYSFARKIDDNLQGRDYELAINVITPLHDKSAELAHFRSMGLERDELIILLNEDARLLPDLRAYKQTEKYVRQTRTSTLREEIQSIIRERAEQNERRRKDLVARVSVLLGQARFVAKGDEIELGGEDPTGRVVRAFQITLDKVYTNLVMLKGVKYNESQLSSLVSEASDGLFGDGGSAALSEAEEQVFNAIVKAKKKGWRATIKTIRELFEKKPYGWPLAAIQAQLAILFARGKIEAKSDSNALDAKNFPLVLKNTAAHANTILEPQLVFSPVQIRQLTEFHNEYFSTVAGSGDAKALALDTVERLKAEMQELKLLHARSQQYPFLARLEPAIARLQEITGKSYQWFLEDLPGASDELLDTQEEVIVPIRKFMSGPQREIFDAGKAFLQREDANLQGELRPGADAILVVLNDDQAFKGNAIQGLKAKLEALRADVAARLDHVRNQAIEELEALKAGFCGDEAYSGLDTSVQANLANAFDAKMSEVKAARLTAVVRDLVRTFRDEEYLQLLARLRVLEPEPELEPTATPGSDAPTPKPVVVKEPQFIALRTIAVRSPKAVLDTEGDVDAYLDVLRQSLLEQIRSGKKVSV